MNSYKFVVYVLFCSKHEKLSIHEDCSYMVIASVITSGSHFTRMNFDTALHQSQNTDDCKESILLHIILVWYEKLI